jgi:hypothetical protein
MRENTNEKLFVASAMFVHILFCEPEKGEIKTQYCLILYFTSL